MDGPAEFDLALDVDDLPLAHAYRGRDAHRVGKSAFAENGDRETVDLADMDAGGIDQQLAAQNFFLITLPDPVVAVLVRLQSRFDMRALDQRRIGGRREMPRLLHQAAQRLGSRDEFSGIADQTRRMVDDARHRCGG